MDTNVTGTLNLLEEAVAAGVGRFVFTSTTSAFGRALTPPPGAPAAWITEDVTPVPRNIYGATKTAAEDLCELVHRDHGLPCLILRTSRFFPEADDRDDVRASYEDANLKVNELLYRRVDLEDVVSAHQRALERAPEIGFGRYIISATTPFTRDDLAELRADAPAVVRRLFPGYEAVYERLGWRMFPSLERVYVNARAASELGWAPRYDFGSRARAPRGRRGPPQPARGHGRREGLPQRQHGALHRSLGGRVAQLDRRALAGVLVDAGLVVERDRRAAPGTGSSPARDVGADGHRAVGEREVAGVAGAGGGARGLLHGGDRRADGADVDGTRVAVVEGAAEGLGAWPGPTGCMSVFWLTRSGVCATATWPVPTPPVCT